MSKSLKNFISIQQYLSNQWTSAPAQDLRIYFLQHHYSSSLHFSIDRIQEAAAYRQRIETLCHYTNALIHLQQQQHIVHYRSNVHSRELQQTLSNTRVTIRRHLSDDFDTPSCMLLLSHLIGRGIQYAVELQKGTLGPLEPLLAVKSYIIHMMTLFGVDLHYLLLQTDNPTLSSSRSVDIPSHPSSVTSSSTVAVAVAAQSLIEFRSRVRTSGLRGMKLLSKYQKLIKSTSGVDNVSDSTGSGAGEDSSIIDENKNMNTNLKFAMEDVLPREHQHQQQQQQQQQSSHHSHKEEEMLQSIKVALQEVLESCDWARDEALPAIGYRIEDTGSGAVAVAVAISAKASSGDSKLPQNSIK